MKAKKHTKLDELVADLRNKMGAMYGYFSLLEVTNELTGEKLYKAQKILEDSKLTSIKYLPIVKDLLNQFENFDLDQFNNK